MKCMYRRDIDSRNLKNGKIRYRAKFSEQALPTVLEALEHVKKKAKTIYASYAFELICMEYLAGKASYIARDKITPKPEIYGQSRIILQFYPDQLELINEALKEARIAVYSDTEAIHLICCDYLKFARNINL